MSGYGIGRRNFGTSSKGTQNNPRATSSTVCQKCLKTGHYTYECKYKRPYQTRPSRTQLLENPNLYKKLQPPPDLPDEFKNKSAIADKILKDKEEERNKKQKRFILILLLVILFFGIGLQQRFLVRLIGLPFSWLFPFSESE